ncbi:MAG: acylphosphatase [Candidatus Zixiibacteriota bacterium]
MTRLHIRLTGVVQGVGYRYHIARRATKDGIQGWVKNRADGSVEIEAVGERQALEEFLNYARVGPPGAHVEHVTVDWHDDTPEYSGFDIRF